MKKHRIENVLLIVVFVLLYSTVCVAAPSDNLDGKKIGPGGASATIDNIEDGRNLNHGTVPPQSATTTAGGYIIENAAPSLELPRQLLNDQSKVIDKNTYQEASSIVRSNINVLNNQIKYYSDYKDVVNDKMNKALQNSNTGNISEANIVRIRELARLIPQEVKKEKNIAADDSVSNLVKNGEYYKALEKLYATYESKESALAEVEKNITIWQQIDSLIE